MLQLGQWAPSGRRSSVPTQALDTRQRGQSTSQRNSSRPDFTACRQASITGSDSLFHWRASASGRICQRSTSWPVSTRSAMRRASPWPLGVASMAATRRSARALVSGGDFRCLELEGRLALAGGELGRLLHQLAVAALDGGEKSRGQQQPAQQIGGPGLDLVVDAAALALRRQGRMSRKAGSAAPW